MFNMWNNLEVHEQLLMIKRRTLGAGTANRLMFFICPWPLLYVYVVYK